MLEQRFEYKVSVIIPIYNVEQYLAETLESLLAQTISQDEMEVLMINDGSTDGSADICQSYAEKHENFKLISQENQGVSAARNNGIRNAKGKYLLYLDGDDTLSSETVQNVTDFFDAHYNEVDVVTYPLIYRGGAEDRRHWRYDKCLTNTGIYDLERFPYICQTTINICVKSAGIKEIFFDINLRAYEDQTYNLAQCMPLGRLGYCREAAYYYCQRASGAVKQFSHPYHLSETLIKTYETFLCQYHSASYVQAMVLYDIAWRISGDCLYPYHYSSEKLATYKERLCTVIDHIDSRLILDFPAEHIHVVYKYYLLSLKKKNRPFAAVGKDGLWLLDNAGALLHEQRIQIVVTESKIKNGEFVIGAHIKSVIFDFIEKPQLFAVTKSGKSIEIPLEVSQFGCLWASRLNTNRFWYFRHVFSLDHWKDISFRIKLRGEELETVCWFHPMQTIQPALDRPYIKGGGVCVLYEADGHFRVLKADESIVRAQERQFKRRVFKGKKKNWLARKVAGFYGITHQGRIWLYCDSVGVGRDNGYYQFIHDFYKKDGISRYYVTRDMDFARSECFDPQQKKHILEFGSKKHKTLYLNCDKAITAYIEPHNYFPFDWETYNLYRDLKEPEIVYLQHGVLHAHMPYKYSFEKTTADYEVVSTHYEVENLTKNYGFPLERLVRAGMPRYDYIAHEPGKEKRKILLAPSWRHFLIEYNGNGGWTPQIDRFKKSSYYQEFQKFLSSPALGEMLEKYCFELDVKLHPIFTGYSGCFSIPSPLVHIVSGEVDRSTYNVFITDFSSFTFDFVYRKCAILYFFPDYDMFRAGINDYRELDIPIENGFGPYAQKSEDALSTLEAILARGGRPEERYLSKMEGFFLHYDNGQCDRIYEFLSEER